jgi:hypothetical protein
MDRFIPNAVSTTKSLTNDELPAAIETLRITAPTFPKINRKLVDPYRAGEPAFALFSYVKAPGATPDEKGFFGAAKIRGVFHSKEEADERAEELIRDVDSTNSIFTCLVGRPFPLIDEGCAIETNQVDLQKKTEDAIAINVREKRKKEQKEMDEIKDRQAELMRDVDPNKPIDEGETYTEQRTKLAHLRYQIGEHANKGLECEALRDKTIKWLLEASAKNPELEAAYFERYMNSRRKAGIPENYDTVGFMRYMVDPISEDERVAKLRETPVDA